MASECNFSVRCGGLTELQAGTGVSGAAIPFIMSWSLQHFTFRTILRAWGLANFVFLAPMLFFIKPRVPVTGDGPPRRRINWKFVWSPAFLCFQVGNTLHGLGYFIPGIYLPSYATSIGMGTTSTTATVALLNTTTVLGCISVGMLIDRFHVTTVLCILAVGSTIATLVLWGLSTQMPTLLIFSAVYGFFAGPYTSTYTGVVTEVRKQDSGAELGLVMGLLAAGRGIGNIASGPLSEALLRAQNVQGRTKSGYNGAYENLVLFTGVCVACGGFGFAARRLGWF